MADPCQSPRQQGRFNVPYLGHANFSYEYTPSEDIFTQFEEFPAKYLCQLMNESIEITEDEAIAGLIQTWLYFGTISEFSSRSVKNELLSRSGRHISYNSFQKIDGIIDNEFSSTEAERNEKLDLLLRVTYAIRQFEHLPISSSSFLHYTGVALFSAKCLVAYLARRLHVGAPYAARDALTALLLCPRGARYYHDEQEETIGAKFVMLDFMVSRGWCPRQIKSLLTQNDAWLIRLYSMQSRQDPPGQIDLIENLEANGKTKHHNCHNSQDCLLGDTSREGFKPCHVSQCSLDTCDHVGLSDHERNKMESILEQDEIPVVKCVMDDEERLTLTIVKYNFRMRYTAISHVWADGLGSATDHHLPKCQMKSIHNSLLRVQDNFSKSPWSRVYFSQSGSNTVYFWMDVFCIPKIPNSSDPERARNLMNKALNLMTPTYGLAESVLVLDSEIQNFDLQNESLAFWRVLGVSRWMSRYWTLQEGALASGRKLWFKTKQDISSYHRVNSSDGTVDLPFVGAIKWTSFASDVTMRDIQFRSVWANFCGRSTSYSEDAYIILANLLDYNFSALMKIKSSELGQSQLTDQLTRLRAIFLNQDTLPIEFLCTEHRNSISSTDSLSWIPTTPGVPKLAPHSVRATRRMHIHRKKRYMRLDPVYGPKGFIFRDIRDIPQRFCFRFPDSNKRYIEVKLNVSNNSSDAPEGYYLFLGLIDLGSPLILDLWGKGACFKIIRQARQHIMVKYQCSVSFQICYSHEHQHGFEEYHAIRETVFNRVNISLDSDFKISTLQRRSIGQQNQSTINLLRLSAVVFFGLTLFVFGSFPTLGYKDRLLLTPVGLACFLMAIICLPMIISWRVSYLSDVRASIWTKLLWRNVAFVGGFFFYIDQTYVKLSYELIKIHGMLWAYPKQWYRSSTSTHDSVQHSEEEELLEVHNNQYQRYTDIIGEDAVKALRRTAEAFSGMKQEKNMGMFRTKHSEKEKKRNRSHSKWRGLFGS